MAATSDSQTGSTVLCLLREPDSPQAWRAFVRRYTPKLLAWCRQWKLQEADAEDVTQEVLHRLARHMRGLPYDPAKGHFRAWLKTLARHAWTDLWAGRRRAGWGSGDPAVQRLLEEQAGPADLAEALEPEFARELYEEATARVRLRVSRATWQAFELLALEGKSGAEVAARLHMKVAAVYMAKSRVQQMLRNEIQKLGGG
jgi:RNA polymerase sigma-70 factor (ECF subfamily)